MFCARVKSFCVVRAHKQTYMIFAVVELFIVDGDIYLYCATMCSVVYSGIYFSTYVYIHIIIYPNGALIITFKDFMTHVWWAGGWFG